MHTVDGLFGIVADAQMKASGEYYLKYLADRVSGMENNRKKYLFNRKYVRIEEDVNSPIEDMEFIAGSIGGFKPQPPTGQSGIAANVSTSLPVTGQGLF